MDTARLADHIYSYSTALIEPRAITVAQQCVLDWFGVAIAGASEPVARLVREEFVANSTGKSSVIGSPETCRPADAALVNGTTSHALDYDDVHPSVGHPTAAVLPAALAVGEDIGCSGMQLMRAFIAGYETAGYIGAMVMKSHYGKGFHSTATLGSFGAAAAVSVLLKLEPKQIRMALGLAGTQAAGLKSMFGTMAKPFHAGKACYNGVTSARLAASGFTANPNVLEAEQGFVAVMTDVDASLDRDLPKPGSMVVDTLFKYHAACYLTHSAMEAIGQLRRGRSLNVAEVASVELHVPKGHLSVCNIPSPDTGLGTKFSLRHTAAFALAGNDTAAIATYSDALANDAGLVALRDRVSVHASRPTGLDARVVVNTVGGDSFESIADVGVPERDLGHQQKRLSAKFDSLTRPVVGVDASEKLKRAIMSLSEATDLYALRLG